MMTPRPDTFAARIAMLILLLAMLPGCASRPLVIHPAPALDVEHIPTVESVDLLAVTPEMNAFLKQHIRPGKDMDDKAWNLVYTSLSPDVLAFEYNPMITLSGPQAFEQRQGNCLTFSAMFIALARQAGMRAWFQEVQVFPEWDNQEDTALVSMHVNAVIRGQYNEYMIDVSRRERKSSEVSRRMTDTEAEAQFYNNLGADALVEGDLPLAYAYFHKSIETHAGLAYVWSNLGVTLKRNGQLEAAVEAYEIALEIEPDHNTSMNNLIVLYEETERLDRVEALTKKVEGSRQKNPYYLRFQAELANKEFRHEEAVDYSRRAVRLARNDYRLHYTLAESLYLNGDYSKALASLEKARDLAPKDIDADQLTLPIDH